MDRVFEGKFAKNFTATATIGKQGGKLLGILCNTTSGGTIAVADTVQTITPAVTPTALQFIPMPCDWNGVLTITVTGTINCTAFYDL